MANFQSGFDFISSYCEGQFSIDKYQSKRTGMKFYHVKVPASLNKVEICVQTRPDDDTGCAHTLEHLIFMGSKKYPKQGYLDHIATRFFSLGTNATTFRDMTTYELTTVNSKSILTLVPIYLDHIFNPLLTKDCYLTEIHNICGETGEDGGVVYSEMQSSENESQEILMYSLLRQLSNENEPFFYEAGGRLDSIRNELNLEKIKIFHKKFYVPKNVAVVVCCSNLTSESLVEMFDKFEAENFAEVCAPIESRRKKFKNQQSEKEKVFVESNRNENSFCDSENFVSLVDSSSSDDSAEKTVKSNETQSSSTENRSIDKFQEIFYPIENEEENLGQLVFAYRLESIFEIENFTAIDVLLTTLFDDDISIFYKEFIEFPNVFCSNIDHDWFNYSERILVIQFEAVRTENLTLLAEKFGSTLLSIVDSAEHQQHLLTQIRNNIKKEIQLHLDEIEKEPLDYLTDLCCLDHISELSATSTYQEKQNNEELQFHRFFMRKSFLEQLYEKPISFWYDLIRKYLIEWDASKRTVILLKPSNDLLIEQEEKEEKRLKERREGLGRSGLKKLREELEKARSNNKKASSNYEEIEIPASVSLENIEMPPIDLVSNENGVRLFHSPTSKFNRFAVHIPLENLDEKLQIYLPLLTNLLFHSPIKNDEIEICKEDFCLSMSRDVLNWKTRFGQIISAPSNSNRLFSHSIDKLTILLQSSNEKEIFRATFNYLDQVLFSTSFDDFNIILEEAEKLHKEYIDILQDGSTIHQEFFNRQLLQDRPEHFFHRTNIFVQKNFIENICRNGETVREETIENLKKIFQFLKSRLTKIHLTVCGNVDLIREQFAVVENFIRKTARQTESDEQIKQLGSPNSQNRMTIVGSPHEESGFVAHWARLEIDRSDLIPLLVLSNYLDMENGPLWSACRTNGYSYGVSFDFDLDENLILLSIDQCSQVNLAFQAAISALKNLGPIDFERFQAAKNLTISVLIERFGTLGRATNISISTFFHGFSLEKYKDLINEIDRFQYDEERLRKMIERYVSPLINLKLSSTLILVNSNKIKETRKFLVQQFRANDVLVIKDLVKHLTESV